MGITYSNWSRLGFSFSEEEGAPPHQVKLSEVDSIKVTHRGQGILILWAAGALLGMALLIWLVTGYDFTSDNAN